MEKSKSKNKSHRGLARSKRKKKLTSLQPDIMRKTMPFDLGERCGQVTASANQLSLQVILFVNKIIGHCRGYPMALQNFRSRNFC